MKNFFVKACIGALLASTGFAQTAKLLAGGTLDVRGVANSERIEVTTVSSSVRVKISSIPSGYVYLDKSFPAAGLQRLYINAGVGNDDIRNETSFESRIFGGDGNDTIFGGAGHDVIWGESGHDTLFGRGDDDSIYGGSGSDYLDGGSGADGIHGEDGNDQLFGGDGSDHLIGGDGADVLHGNAGADTLVGGDRVVFDDYVQWIPDGEADTMLGHGGLDYFAFELIDTRVGNHGTPGYESVSTKWWKGVEPWIYNAWDSNPGGAVKYWQCGG
jgi:Ca2+-binding RTX toxin-like protein